MSCFAVFTSRTPDHDDRCLFLCFWSGVSQSFKIFTADQERGSEVGGECVIPSLKGHVCDGNVPPCPNSVVDDEDLHGTRMFDGGEHIRDGRLIGEIGLNRLDIGVGFCEASQGLVLGVVVGCHLCAKRCRIGLVRVRRLNARMDLQQ